MGLGGGVVPRGRVIEYRLVGFARSAGDDIFKGAKGVSSRLASECRSPTRPHGQDLTGQHDVGVPVGTQATATATVFSSNPTISFPFPTTLGVTPYS